MSAGYGPFRALFDVSLTVEPGEAVALLGPERRRQDHHRPRGTGLVAPTEGAVLVEGADMTGAPVHRFAAGRHHPRARGSIGVRHADRGGEPRALVPALPGHAARWPPTWSQAFELFPALASRRNQVAGTLSGGEQRMLAMARVLVEEPKLLVADELSLGLAPIIVDEVYASLERLRGRGHRAAHRRTARRPCVGALRSGGPARPWRDHVGGAVLRRRRSRRDGRVRARVAQRDARAAAMAASAAFSVASLPFLASVNMPGIRWGCLTK